MIKNTNAGIVGSNPICVIMRVGSGLVAADPPSKESY
jgi:hypothetical protein